MDALRRYGLYALAAALIGVSLTVTTGELAAYALLPQLAAVLAVCAGRIQADALSGGALTAAAAAAANLYLLQQKVESATGRSLCNIDEVFNCDKVNASPWSLAFGVPITLFGAAFYGGLMLAALQAPTGAKATPHIYRLFTLFGAAASAYSLFLLAISKQIGALCVVCMTIYGASFLLVWAGVKGLRGLSAGVAQDLPVTARSTEALTLAAVFVIGTAWGNSWYTNATALPELDLRPRSPDAPAQPPQEDLFAMLYAKAPGPVTVAASEPRLGPADARYRIVEFADFGCPHCAEAEHALKELVAANPDVSVVFKVFPLSGACNPMLADPRDPAPDPSRCLAAYAAACAHEQGKFWEMSHLLFTNQGYFAPEHLDAHATSIGLDMNAFHACVQAPATHARVEASAREGEALGLRGTPSLFLEGAFDQPVQLQRGVPSALTVIEAHRDGAQLPAPR